MCLTAITHKAKISIRFMKVEENFSSFALIHGKDEEVSSSCLEPTDSAAHGSIRRNCTSLGLVTLVVVVVVTCRQCRCQ